MIRVSGHLQSHIYLKVLELEMYRRRRSSDRALARNIPTESVPSCLTYLIIALQWSHSQHFTILDMAGIPGQG